MTDIDVMNHLKVDLQIITTEGTEGDALTDYLKSLIQTAKSRIQEEGITLTGDPNDRNLIEQYAAWLYRSRKSEKAAEKMPRPLRYGLNNRLLTEKMKKGLS